ncbi:MAG: hypothetical protein MO846_10625 [Candidatus Devosia symbiotica]|nr:hypothetical protein [Candidatus Devosia symbiotica]
MQAQNIGQIQLFPGAARMLVDLHATGIKLALLSSNAEANIRRVLGSSAELFKHYGCGSSLWGKPAKFRATLKVTDVTAAAAVCLGDEVRARASSIS